MLDQILSPPRIVQAMAIKHAILLYIKTGLQANSAYTPTAMRQTAEKITGQSYKGRSGLARAAEDLDALIGRSIT